jgi:hypothetical protein
MHTITRLFLVNDHIQRMSEYLTNPEAIPLAELQRELGDAQRTLDTTLLPSVKVDGHAQALNKLADKLRAIEKTLNAGPRSSKDAEDLFIKLKEQLDETTPERIAWKFLPAAYKQ